MQSPLVVAATLALPCLAPAGHAALLQEVRDDEPDEVVRLEEWPEPASKAEAKKDLEKVRKAGTEEMLRQGREALLAEGAAVVPIVLKSFERERDEDILERLEALLVDLTDARLTRLLAREFGHRTERVRVWALLRVAAFPDEGVRADAEAALAKVRKKEEKASQDELYAAGLCVTSAGSLEGMPEVTARVLSDWKDHKLEVRAALEAVRGPEASAIVLPGLRADSRKERIAALRMLAGCGGKECVGDVAPFLDETDNSIRIEAINALRGIVDGDSPIDKLSAFEAIEVANEWKGKL